MNNESRSDPKNEKYRRRFVRFDCFYTVSRIKQSHFCLYDNFGLSAVYHGVQKWKNCWNRTTFAEVIIKIEVALF